MKYFKKPSFRLSHKDLSVAAGEGGSRPFEFAFESYMFLILSRPFWRGVGANENDTLARVDASLRIQDALEADGDVVELSDGDHAWFVQEAREVRLDGQLQVLNPKLAKFFRVLLTATSTDPRTQARAEANGATTVNASA